MSIAARWEHFPHGADVGVAGIGSSPAEAFEQAGVALTAVTVEPETVRSTEAVDIRCTAPGLDLLLVDWLNALVFEMAGRRLVFGSFEVQIAGDQLVGRAWGEPLDRRRHRPAVEVKGATYTSLAVSQGADGAWRASCVVDV